MKKLTKKLLLSAITLGLALVTLTTTTFAWYTTSKTATASGTGVTSGETSDSTLMISTNGNDWSQNVTFADNEAFLLPVQWNGGTFQNIDGEPAGANDYYEFKLYFKTTKSVPTSGTVSPVTVYLNKILLTNTGTMKEYDNLTNGSITNCPTDSKYVIDATRAMDLVIGTKGYNLSGQYNYKTGESGFGQNNENIATADALSYYNAVMSASKTREGITDLTQVTVAEKATGVIANANYIEIGSMTATAGENAVYSQLEITFKLFLNGWDQYCFDACKGQSFSLVLGFTTEK